MAENGTASIFRVTTSGQTETLVTDKVDMGSGAVTPDAKTHLVRMKPRMQIIETENPNPGSQDAPTRQDVGNAPLIVDIWGYFKEQSGDALAITTFRNWMKSPKIIKNLFQKGRFGLRNNIRPEFDCTPDNTGGYQLVVFETDERYDFLGIVPFYCQLKFYGDFDRLGT